MVYSSGRAATLIVPLNRDPTIEVTGSDHSPNGRERHVSGDKPRARGRQFRHQA